MKRLPLLKGLRWEGHLRLLQPQDGGYVVAFNAFEPATGQYVYDQTVLTHKQLKDWTGVDAK